MTLHGKRIVLGVCGGIAAYKAVDVLRRLSDADARVAPVLSEGATRFVAPLTFSALAGEPARTSLWDSPEPIPHTRLGQGADAIVVAPATASLLGRYAAGISDDLLTATLLATRAPVVLAPAMHTEMWEHPATQANIAILRGRRVVIVDPEEGRLAGGDVGAGRLADPAAIVDAVTRLFVPGDFEGRTVLVTSGGTREPIDPVRFIGNRSTGKMGAAVATAAVRRGARVVYVTTTGTAPAGAERVDVETAAEMAEAVLSRAAHVDVIVMAAAVADFRPEHQAAAKLKKEVGPPEVHLVPTTDILAAIGATRGRAVVIGFAAETEEVAMRGAEKRARKGADLLVANLVGVEGSGFAADTNRAWIAHEGGVDDLGTLTKADLAEEIMERAAKLLVGSSPPPH